MKQRRVNTPEVSIAYEEGGPASGEAIILLHGWPDDVRTWDSVAPELNKAGYRTIIPYLRGYGPSRFRRSLFGAKSRRTGQPVAFAMDIIEMANRLRLRTFHFIGHDWGARTGYVLCAFWPERLKSLIAISVPFQPGTAAPPAFPQAQAFWYQWLLCSHPGEQKFREDPVAFAKAQWDAWSPTGWYSQQQFETTAQSWRGADFPDVVLHSYRSRWGHASHDPKYERLQRAFESTRHLNLPTLLVHGREDRCELPATTDGAERHFKADYRRVLMDGVGHFPQRERPDLVTSQILTHIRECT